MLVLELARTIEADRRRERDMRERAAGRLASGRRHPVAPAPGLPEEPDAARLPRAMTSRPAVG